jgi:uncharacterized protein (TIGR03435 family)
MQLMLQTLLAERFHLSLHHEEKLEQGYALIVDKDGSKLQAAAAPADEQDFEKRLGSDVQRQTIKFKNAGMPLVASLLMEQADTSRTHPGPPPRIVDMTGLKGGYDFTLEWDRPEPDADGVLPERLPALIGALRKVGLSLKSQKVPVDHVVIDHVDKAPTGN